MSCCDGFRLAAASECSLRSKARIDALFEDSRSVCSSMATGPGCWTGLEAGPGCCADEDQQRRVNSAVQARIEAMFASVEAESVASPSDPANANTAASVLPVKYMGAAPVGGRVASVRGLQEPLRQLAERIEDSVSAELEVSRRGLTFRTSELHEKNNPFRRIAVWSALKLQVRRRHNSNGSNNNNNSSNEDVVHAFVPLVADERIYEPASTSNCEDRHAELYRTMRGLAKDVADYPPIFAVVMRRPGAARLLECHAFACRCEEDAIAAAATLYRALLADLDATARRPRQRNGLGCASLASVASSLRETSPRSRRSCATAASVFRGSRENLQLDRAQPPPLPPPLSQQQQKQQQQQQSQPVRPPRVKKNSIGSGVNTEDERSSSSVGTSVDIVDKLPRRKKKNSDVKAEDVLEARSRRFCSPSKTSNANESNVHSRHAENHSSSDSSRLEIEKQTNEERRMNAKNKIYDTRSTQSQTTEDEVQVIEKIYDEQQPRTEIVEVYNENHKSSSDRERSGSYDFECCTENSLYESSRIYAKARMAGSKPQSKGEQRNYGASRTSGSSTPSRKSTAPNSTSSNPDNEDVTTRAPYRRLVESGYVEQRRRNMVNGVARHRDHFRDADKIYNLDSEESCFSARQNSQVYNVSRSNRQVSPALRNERSELSARSTKRLARVATMDRPLRRSGLETSANHRRQSLTQRVVPQIQQQQQQQQQQQEPRQRRRSRAGSEPPTSRTEAAAAASTAALLKRSQSDLDLDRGDLLTRVELPRRSSFLKPGSVRKRDAREGGGGGTPLGFTELFDEFRNQEGLTSVDDILAAIIDPEGMSFNELKPLYKEFLLKLAATLTQDELYQRSASIMRRRRRPQRRRSSRGLLRRAIKRSVSRLRSSSSGPTEFTSVVFPARRLNERGSYGSSSSCDVAAVAAAAGAHQHRLLAAGKLARRRSSAAAARSKSRVGHTTSEDSDTCRRIERAGLIAANRSSSGYVSCSECSYDSESCTCVSADKCYCSLSRRTEPVQAAPTTLVCSCDTDSCSESNKCYCARRPAQRPQQPSILEQLRQKGIVPSESTLSRGDSPERTRSARATRSLATSKSLEYLKVRGSADNLALDYELFRPGGGGRRSSRCSSGSEKVLVVSARDPRGRLIYVGGTERPGGGHGSGGSGTRDGTRRSSRLCSHRHPGSAGSTGGHHEALSIKKSAEIAAVFGAGPYGSRVGRRTSSASSLRSSVSLEAGLGYLP